MAVAKNMCRNEAVKAFQEELSVAQDGTSSSTSSNSNSLPSQALQMLEMVRSATRNIPSVAGLFMDELASIFEYDDIDMDLIKWISDKMVYSFDGDFVSSTTHEDNEGKICHEEGIIPLKLAFKLNRSNANIAIDLGN